ncbi:EamA family transporter [Aureivirga sp. CE67]|uniref:EamA family transporter n=1 Tax=Aureivirga sp. CE67 TaxID=1788983 RepID=UPI0018CAB9B4|nr:EamA family transporter [Aureivirga sp. CE67]
MIHLLLSIILSSFLFVIFKYFEKFRIDNLQAIVVNYFVAFSIGYATTTENVHFTEIPAQPWFYGVLFLGFLFIFLFNVMALTAQKAGMSVVSVAGKMSVVIPITFGIIVYNESYGVVKILGILLALLSVYLTSRKDSSDFDQKYLYLPIILFVGSGILDTTIKYVENNYVSDGGLELYSASIFLVAGMLGVLLLSILFIMGKVKFQFKNIIGGIVLGIPNYYTIFYLLKALEMDHMETSTIFTVNNVATVSFSTLLGIMIFKERLNKRNWIGVVLSIIAIILVTL